MQLFQLSLQARVKADSQALHSTVVLSSFPFEGVPLECLRISMTAQAVLWSE